MIQTALVVMRKDLLIEWRSRVVAWQIVPFGIISLVLCALAVGPKISTMRHAAPGLFYLVVLLIALLTIGRSQTIEARSGTRTSIKMLGLDPGGVFLGKFVALLLELCLMSSLMLVGAVVGLHAPLHGTLLAIPSIALALAAMSAGGCIYGSLLGDAKTHATLLPVLVLPPFAAVLIAGEKAFAGTISGQAPWRWIGFLAGVALAYMAVGVLLYGIAEES